MPSKLPEIGKFYDCYDDGKIHDSRKYLVRITNIIPFSEISSEILKKWEEYKEGRFSDWEADSSNDLLMEGIKKEGWINIYETVSERCIGAVHKSKEEAMRVKVNEKDVTYKDTVRVEWEE